MVKRTPVRQIDICCPKCAHTQSMDVQPGQEPVHAVCTCGAEIVLLARQPWVWRWVRIKTQIRDFRLRRVIQARRRSLTEESVTPPPVSTDSGSSSC